MSANEREGGQSAQKGAKARKRAQKSKKEQTNCEQPSLEQPGLGTPTDVSSLLGRRLGWKIEQAQAARHASLVHKVSVHVTKNRGGSNKGTEQLILRQNFSSQELASHVQLLVNSLSSRIYLYIFSLLLLWGPGSGRGPKLSVPLCDWRYYFVRRPL